MTPARAIPEPDSAQVLTKAFLRAGDLLGLTQAAAARILGVSEASVSRLSGARSVAPDSKEGELALLFVRLYRSLDALFGGHVDQCRAWFDAHNYHLGAMPRELVTNVEGLVRVTQYLDAMRGKM